jgi:hypothetical protein
VTGGKSQAPDPAPAKRCISPTARASSAESGEGSRRENTSAKAAGHFPKAALATT